MYPDPIWPVIVMAALMILMGIGSIKPAPQIAQTFETVNLPKRVWPLIAPLKFAGALGLILGIWIPVLGLVTILAIVAYFALALASHVRVRDFGQGIVGSAVMLAVSLAVLLISFVF